MKKSRLISLILSLCLIVSIVGTTIDWSFLDAFAEANETVIVPEDVPETISENEVLENGDEESLLEEEALPEEPVSELDAEADGLRAVYTCEAGFMPGSAGIIEKLSEEEAGKLATALSEGMSGRTAVPVCGFKLDVQADGFTAADFAHVKISGLGDGQELYRFEDTFEKTEFEKDEENGITFEAALPGTYLFINMEYDEEPLTFSYSDDEVTVTAVCLAESGIPEDAALTVRKIEEGTDEYKDAYDKVLASMDLKEGETLKFAPYDVSFVKDGQEIEPSNGTVSIKMEFAEDPIKANPEDEVLGDVFYVHVKDNGSVEALDAAVKEMGADFEVASFSIMAAAAVSTNAEEAAYAILYSDGSLVFQRGPKADTEYGDVVGSWTGFEDSTDSVHPWTTSWEVIKSVSFKDSIHPVSMSSWFSGLSNCTSFDLKLLNTSQTTSMMYLFYSMNAASLDVSGFDTSNVTSMYGMFMNAGKSLKSLDVSNFDTSNVTSMAYMFYGLENLQELDLSGFNTSKVRSMSGMFMNTYSLQKLDLSSFNTSSVINMSNMFDDCAASEIDISSFNTSNVTNMDGMFCRSRIKNLDLSHFDTHSVTDMRRMFSQSYIETFNLSGFDTSNVIDMSNMFSQNRSFSAIDLSSFDTSSVITMSKMFYKCESLTFLDLSNFDTSNVTDMMEMFHYCSSLVFLNISNFNTSNVKNMTWMFRCCNALMSLNLSSFSTANVTKMDGMFSECIGLKELDLSSFTSDSLTSMGTMFSGCTNLERLYIPNFNLSGPRTCTDAFSRCTNLVFLSVGDIDVDYTCFLISPFTNTSWASVKTGTIFDDFRTGYRSDNGGPGSYARVTDITFDTVYGGKKVVKSYLGATMTELPNVPERTGSYFTGWFTQRSGGEELRPGETVESLTYYAHYTDYQYTLILNPNGGEGNVVEIPLGYHEDYRLPSAGYEYPDKSFTGWSTRKNGNGSFYGPGEYVFGLSDIDGGSVTLYAQYADSDDMVTVSFDTDGAGDLVPMVVKRGMRVVLPEAKKDHYTFVGWREPDSEQVLKPSYDRYYAGTDVTLLAVFYKNPIVTFDTSGVTSENITREVSYGGRVSPIPEIPPYSNNYMTLIGWFTEPDGGEILTGGRTFSSDTTLYAHWGWVPKFNTTGGTIVSDGNLPIQEGSSLYYIEKLPQVERDGYTFDGWYLGDGSTKLEDGCSIDLSKGINIDARWTKNDVVNIMFCPTSTFALNNRSFGVNLSISCRKGSPIGTFPTITGRRSNVLDGFGTYQARFAGWADEDGRIYTESDIVTSDLILTALTEDADVILTFDPNGGSVPVGQNVVNGKMAAKTGGTLNSLPGSKLANYILKGWYTQKDGAGEKLTTDTIITEPRTYYAFWEPFSLTADDESSIYTYGAEWSNASNGDVTNQDGSLEWHTGITSSVSSNLHVRFELNDKGGDLTLPAGSVKIRVPQHIWKDWDGNNTGTTNISAMLPEYPNVSDSIDFAYTIDGSDFIILNTKELSGSAGLDMEICYTANPAEIPNGGADSNGCYLPEYNFYKGIQTIEFSIDKDLDGIPESQASQQLSNEMHAVGLTLSAYESSNLVYYQWQPSWGDEPADSDDYVYVRWGISKSPSKLSPYFASIDVDTSLPHDGSVIYADSVENFKNNYAYYFVTKHPLSDLLNAPSSGLVLKSSAAVTAVTPSGYAISYYVNSSKTLYAPVGTLGSYSKTNESRNGLATTVRGGQDAIVGDESGKQMRWYINYSGNAKGAVWDEEAGICKTPERTIRLRDGDPGDVMYSSGSASSKFIWEPDTGNVILNDSDYCFTTVAFSIKNYESRFENGFWTPPKEISQYTDDARTAIYLRYTGSDEYVFWRYASNSVFISLPENVVGVEGRYASSYYKTDFNMSLTMELKPSARVRRLFTEDVDQGASSIIKNSAVCDVWNSEDGEEKAYFHTTDNLGGNNQANQNCYEMTLSKTTQSTTCNAGNGNVSFDPIKGTQDVAELMSGININDGNALKPVTEGIFYNLLPEGTSVDPKTIYGIAQDYTKASDWQYYTPHALYYDTDIYHNDIIPASCYDVRFEQNWQNSGRTMMIVKFSLPESLRSNNIVAFLYKLHNTYENILEHGTTAVCDVAFVNLSENRVRPAVLAAGISKIPEAQYFENIDKQYSGYVSYNRQSANYINVSAYSWGFHTAVQTGADYGLSGRVLVNGLYTYRLSYSQSEHSTSKGLVFYDFLENGSNGIGEDGETVQNVSQWHGTLEYVNTGEASAKLTDGSETLHCRPVVYYSVKPRDEFTDADLNLSKADVWSAHMPDNKSEITAVAIDCSKNEDGSDFVMKGKESLNMYVVMRAPKEAGETDLFSYNEGVLSAMHELDEKPTLQYGDTSVTICDVDPEFHKTSSPAGGTSNEPGDIFKDDELSYILEVSNPSGEFTLNDIIIEDIFPQGCTVDTSSIVIYFDDPGMAQPIKTSPRADMTFSERMLKVTISSLLPDETIHVKVPVIVNVSSGILENTAHLTSMNSVTKDLVSESVYHKAQPADMAVKKIGLQKGIAGASMQILDSMGAVVCEWVSDETTHHVDLPAGDYIIHEVSAPAGYLKADDIKVNLSRNGVLTLEDGTVVSPVIMQDDWTKIKIETQDPDGNPQPGCETVIYRTEDVVDGVPVNGAEPVARWTSEENPYEILGKLEAGNSYVVIEESVPEEYMPGKPVTFTVAEDGSEQTIVIQSTKKGTEVIFRKVDEIGNALSGAELKVSIVVTEEVSEAELQSLDILTNMAGDDAAGLNNTNAAVDESFISGTEPYTLLLEPGDYVFHEENAPLGYAAAADIYFTVTEDGKIMIGSEEVSEVVMTDNMEFHTLSVIKVVKGSMGDKTKKFKFRLTLTASDMEGLPSSEIPETMYLPYTLSTANDSNPRNDTGIMPVIAGGDSDDQPANTLLLTNGVCKFELAHGEAILFDLPYGIGYKVEELDAAGYEVESEGAEGVIGNADAAASFTNTKNGTVATGFKASTGLTAGFGILSGILALVLVLYRLKIYWKKK